MSEEDDRASGVKLAMVLAKAMRALTAVADEQANSICGVLKLELAQREQTAGGAGDKHALSRLCRRRAMLRTIDSRRSKR